LSEYIKQTRILKSSIDPIGILLSDELYVAILLDGSTELFITAGLIVNSNDVLKLDDADQYLCDYASKEVEALRSGRSRVESSHAIQAMLTDKRPRYGLNSAILNDQDAGLPILFYVLINC